jgi:hypothetical protein
VVVIVHSNGSFGRRHWYELLMSQEKCDDPLILLWEIPSFIQMVSNSLA